MIVLISTVVSPATATVWDANGGTGGDFATAGNWIGDVLPGINDLAQIDSNSSAAIPVTLASGTITVDNVDLGATTASFMEVNGGTLIFEEFLTPISKSALAPPLNRYSRSAAARSNSAFLAALPTATTSTSARTVTVGMCKRAAR